MPSASGAGGGGGAGTATLSGDPAAGGIPWFTPAGAGAARCAMTAPVMRARATLEASSAFICISVWHPAMPLHRREAWAVAGLGSLPMTPF